MAEDDEQDHSHGGGHTPSEMALRVKALETLLTRRGYVDQGALDAIVDTYQNKIGPRNGAKVVAKAWSDPDFHGRLLTDATAAIGELGFIGMQGEHVVAVENSDAVHNVVVCTLCSCYPWSLLGLPPAWYKSHAYRSRVVIEPRKVLQEFGVTLGEDTEVRVWDSTSEMRYLVVPQRPAGTDGLDENALAELVTRNAMIGTEILTVADGGAA